MIIRTFMTKKSWSSGEERRLSREGSWVQIPPKPLIFSYFFKFFLCSRQSFVPWDDIFPGNARRNAHKIQLFWYYSKSGLCFLSTYFTTNMGVKLLQNLCMSPETVHAFPCKRAWCFNYEIPMFTSVNRNFPWETPYFRDGSLYSVDTKKSNSSSSRCA